MKTKALLFILVIFNMSAYAQNEKYYMSKTLDLSMDVTIVKVKEVLKEQGFGIVSEDDMDKTLKNKLGDIDMKPMKVLGACNAKLAYKVLQAEENMAIYLPCKVLIKYKEDNKTEVVFVNPKVAMNAVDNKEALDVMEEAFNMLKKAFVSL